MPAATDSSSRLPSTRPPRRCVMQRPQRHLRHEGGLPRHRRSPWSLRRRAQHGPSAVNPRHHRSAIFPGTGKGGRPGPAAALPYVPAASSAEGPGHTFSACARTAVSAGLSEVGRHAMRSWMGRVSSSTRRNRTCGSVTFSATGDTVSEHPTSAPTTSWPSRSPGPVARCPDRTPLRGSAGAACHPAQSLRTEAGQRTAHRRVRPCAPPPLRRTGGMPGRPLRVFEEREQVPAAAGAAKVRSTTDLQRSQPWSIHDGSPAWQAGSGRVPPQRIPAITCL
jgi:hypothetical protein